MSDTIASLEAQLTAGTKIYQKLQQGKDHLARPNPRLLTRRPPDFTNAVEARQRLDAQKAENEAVKKVRCFRA